MKIRAGPSARNLPPEVRHAIKSGEFDEVLLKSRVAQSGPQPDRSFSRKLVFGRDLQRQESDKWFFSTLPFSVTASLSRSGIKISVCH